jgi:hypothetical protein
VIVVLIIASKHHFCGSQNIDLWESDPEKLTTEEELVVIVGLWQRQSSAVRRWALKHSCSMRPSGVGRLQHSGGHFGSGKSTIFRRIWGLLLGRLRKSFRLPLRGEKTKQPGSCEPG